MGSENWGGLQEPTAEPSEKRRQRHCMEVATKLAAATRHEQLRHSNTKRKERMKDRHEHRFKEQL